MFKKLLGNEEKQNPLKLFKDSKVVATSVDEKNLLAFFNPKKVKSVKLLYRASDYGFLVSKFHEKCDGIPHTLIILKT